VANWADSEVNSYKEEVAGVTVIHLLNVEAYESTVHTLQTSGFLTEIAQSRSEDWPRPVKLNKLQVCFKPYKTTATYNIQWAGFIK
jgi:hypothetical protein